MSYLVLDNIDWQYYYHLLLLYIRVMLDMMLSMNTPSVDHNRYDVVYHRLDILYKQCYMYRSNKPTHHQRRNILHNPINQPINSITTTVIILLSMQNYSNFHRIHCIENLNVFIYNNSNYYLTYFHILASDYYNSSDKKCPNHMWYHCLIRVCMYRLQ
jgi:hypothetical protein